MEHIYFRHDLDVIYFVYGLSFFIMGYSILTQYKPNNIFKIGRIIWLLGLFGVLHGINEWLDMWTLIKGRTRALDDTRWAFLIMSYCFLLSFGFRMCLRRSTPANVMVRAARAIRDESKIRSGFNRIFSYDLWLISSIVVVIGAISVQSDDFWTTSNILSRYFMGLTGSILTAAGFIMYYYREDEKLRDAANMKYKFWVLALSFLVYGILGGLIVPRGNFFPANVLNVEWFHSVTNLPVRLIRGLFVSISALNIGNILSTFQGETNCRLEEALANEKAIEGELLTSREQFRSLATRLQSLIEQERTRIARELHDEVGQSLTSLKIDIDELLISHVASDNSHPASVRSDPRLVSQINAIERSIDSVIDRMHNIATDLRPSILDQLGLLAAIQWQAKRFEDRTGIKCNVRVSHKVTSSLDSFGPEASTAIFRIFQEAITNVCRHANANKVNAFMYNKGGDFIVKIVDDGRGIEEGKIFDYNSLGLLGMRERAAMLGWHLEIKGKPGMSTAVKILTPGTNSRQ
ncbi:MAG: sensor histidine kinase [Nitrospirae bacterium]|nr:sensor histidine kinase [Nitrospirota bacterium]MBF0592996.1 sensor histidine kinase [Nitrospirota bacterium]